MKSSIKIENLKRLENIDHIERLTPLAKYIVSEGISIYGNCIPISQHDLVAAPQIVLVRALRLSRIAREANSSTMLNNLCSLYKSIVYCSTGYKNIKFQQNPFDEAVTQEIEVFKGLSQRTATEVNTFVNMILTLVDNVHALHKWSPKTDCANMYFSEEQSRLIQLNDSLSDLLHKIWSMQNRVKTLEGFAPNLFAKIYEELDISVQSNISLIEQMNIVFLELVDFKIKINDKFESYIDNIIDGKI